MIAFKVYVLCLYQRTCCTAVATSLEYTYTCVPVSWAAVITAVRIADRRVFVPFKRDFVF